MAFAAFLIEALCEATDLSFLCFLLLAPMHLTGIAHALDLDAFVSSEISAENLIKFHETKQIFWNRWAKFQVVLSAFRGFQKNLASESYKKAEYSARKSDFLQKRSWVLGSNLPAVFESAAALHSAAEVPKRFVGPERRGRPAS